MSCRIDKFLWSVRLAKTRSQATEAISKGRVKLNGNAVKPSRDVKVGDEIQVIRHTAVYSYKILALLDKRVGAKLVENYIVDVTSEEEKEKYRLYQLAQSAYRVHGTGKPTKKDRRDLDDFFENWEE
jgi:ribosome-associated heat shock protein Hsp15